MQTMITSSHLGFFFCKLRWQTLLYRQIQFNCSLVPTCLVYCADKVIGNFSSLVTFNVTYYNKKHQEIFLIIIFFKPDQARIWKLVICHSPSGLYTNKWWKQLLKEKILVFSWRLSSAGHPDTHPTKTLSCKHKVLQYTVYSKFQKQRT